MGEYELTPSVMGPFWTGIPLLIGVTCLAKASYFLVIRRHIPLAAFLLSWGIIVETVSYKVPLVKGMDWNVSQNWPGIVLANVLFGVPVVAFYFAWQKETFRKFILSVSPADMISIHVCRVAGAAYMYLFLTLDVPNYVTLMVGVFDLVVSTTALPLASYVRSVGIGAAKDTVRKWHIFGAMDLLVPFALFPFNVCGVVYTPEQSLSFFFQHPIANIVLFNVPLAMINHFLFLTQLDAMVEADEKKKKK